jgi:drug/metabolite transporter (DMT)-like permease
MFSVLLAAVAAGLWGTGDFVGGLMTRRIPVLVVALLTWGSGLLFTALIVLVFDPTIPPARAIAWGLAGGVFGAIGLGSLYVGLAVGRMGIVAPIAAMSILVAVAAGLLQGDRPSSVQVVGMVVAVVGAVLAATAPDPASGKRTAAAGLWFALLAAMFLGLTLVCLDAAGQASAAWGALLLRSASVPLVAIAALVMRPSFEPVRGRDIALLVSVGAADNGGNVLFALSSARGLLTLTSVIASLVPVVTVLLARTLLKERLTRHQTVGVVLALAGVATIAAGG